jgi:hypothetical protein
MVNLFKGKVGYSLRVWLITLISANLVVWQVAFALPNKCIGPVNRALELRALSSTDYATKAGHFKMAKSAERNDLLDQFEKQKKSNSFSVKLDPKKVRRVESDHLAADLGRLSKKELRLLRLSGEKNLSKLGYVTSGAGLWSRGGGAIKALVPYNIKTILGRDFTRLKIAGDIVAAKKEADILRIAGRTGVKEKDLSRVALEIRESAQQEIADLLNRSRYDLSAVNALDMKFVNMALNSRKIERGYVPFDIWTSEQTHAQIKKYITWLRGNLDNKKFHPDPKTNRKVQQALKDYFRRSDDLGETHLFGYQEGFHAIDAVNGGYKSDGAAIGKGAGAIVEYLQKSGRKSVLHDMGVRDIVFENIEVVSDLTPLYGAYKQVNRKVGVVLVPQREGYAGGSPFMIKKADGSWNLELKEMSVLDEQFAEGNKFFNSNTTFYSLDINAPKSTAFELKNQATEARVKLNMGDVTFDNEAAGIGGRVGRENSMVEYENFKNYGEYGENGEWYIGLHQNGWSEAVKPVSGARR